MMGRPASSPLIFASPFGEGERHQILPGLSSRISGQTGKGRRCTPVHFLPDYFGGIAPKATNTAQRHPI